MEIGPIRNQHLIFSPLATRHPPLATRHSPHPTVLLHPIHGVPANQISSCLGGSEDRENVGWVKNSKIDFSLAKNTIVVWAIQVTIGQSAFIPVGKHRHKTNYHPSAT
jgi:hypothetical protein